MTFGWEDAGAEGDVTERECMLGLVEGARLKAAGFMAFEAAGLISANPFWKDAVLDVRASDWCRIGSVCSSYS